MLRNYREDFVEVRLGAPAAISRVARTCATILAWSLIQTRGVSAIGVYFDNHLGDLVPFEDKVAARQFGDDEYSKTELMICYRSRQAPDQ
jgi:hypothetical protein